MKKSLIILLLAASFSLALSCNTPANQTEESAVQEGTITKNVKLDEFQELIANKANAILLDVRTPKEIAEGYIKDSQKIDFYDTDFKAKLDKLDKSKPILVYCHSGRRSGIAMSTMRELGFKEVYNLEGGIAAWEEAGLPTEK